MEKGRAILGLVPLALVLLGKKELVNGGAFYPVCTVRHRVNTVINTIF